MLTLTINRNDNGMIQIVHDESGKAAYNSNLEEAQKTISEFYAIIDFCDYYEHRTGQGLVDIEHILNFLNFT